MIPMFSLGWAVINTVCTSPQRGCVWRSLWKSVDTVNGKCQQIPNNVSLISCWEKHSTIDRRWCLWGCRYGPESGRHICLREALPPARWEWRWAMSSLWFVITSWSMEAPWGRLTQLLPDRWRHKDSNGNVIQLRLWLVRNAPMARNADAKSGVRPTTATRS